MENSAASYFNRGIPEVMNDSTIIEKFTKVLAEHAGVKSTLGNRDEAFLITKSIMVINLLTQHSMDMGHGIPVAQLQHIIDQK